MAGARVSKEQLAEMLGVAGEVLDGWIADRVIEPKGGHFETRDVMRRLAAAFEATRRGEKTAAQLNRELLEARLEKIKADTKRRTAEDDFNLTELCGILQKKEDTIKKWLKKGCPGEKSGRNYAFRVHEVVDWRVAYERELHGEATEAQLNVEGAEYLNPEQERARKDKEMADKTALENRVRRGELVEASEVESVWSDHVTAARARLQSMGSKLAPILAPETRAAVIEAEINKAAAEVGHALADDAGD